MAQFEAFLRPGGPGSTDTLAGRLSLDAFDRGIVTGLAEDVAPAGKEVELAPGVLPISRLIVLEDADYLGSIRQAYLRRMMETTGSASRFVLVARAPSRIIDALPKPFYYGKAVLYPQCRKGHVPGAYNVPAEYNLDPKTGRVRPLAELTELWKHTLAASDTQPNTSYITYCGGGVFASFALFILALMGYKDAALYDASWTEWGADETLPIETGASPIT